MPEIIDQHIKWIASYCEIANETNWRDILDRIQSQVRMAQQDAVIE